MPEQIRPVEEDSWTTELLKKLGLEEFFRGRATAARDASEATDRWAVSQFRNNHTSEFTKRILTARQYLLELERQVAEELRNLSDSAELGNAWKQLEKVTLHVGSPPPTLRDAKANSSWLDPFQWTDIGTQAKQLSRTIPEIALVVLACVSEAIRIQDETIHGKSDGRPIPGPNGRATPQTSASDQGGRILRLSQSPPLESSESGAEE